MKFLFPFLILSSFSSISFAQAKSNYNEGTMFSKVGTKNGKQFIDYTFKLNDTLFQARKMNGVIDELKINAAKISKNDFGKYLNRVNQLIEQQDKESPTEQPNPHPSPQPLPRPKPHQLESEPVEINGKIPYDANKKGVYLSGDIGVYYGEGYTIVKRKEKITKVYYKGDKIPNEKWDMHQPSIERIIKESIQRD